MKCAQCGAPRAPGEAACPYCGAPHWDAGALRGDSGAPQRDPAAPRAGDSASGEREESTPAILARVRRREGLGALLADRAGLPDAPRPRGARSLAPLVFAGVVAAAYLVARRAPDGSFPTRSLWIAAAIVAFGLFAQQRNARRAERRARLPVEALVARLELQDGDDSSPRGGGGGASAFSPLRARWLLALEDGTRRPVWPAPEMRGRDQMARGAAGVAFVRGPHLLRFERLDRG